MIDLLVNLLDADGVLDEMGRHTLHGNDLPISV
jgi:hypothetical protein